MKQNFYPKVKVSGRVRVCLETVTSLNLRNKYIIDIGSSIGWLEKELLKYQPKKLIGVEPDIEAVLYASKKVKGASFVQGSAVSLPVSNNTADIVVMFDTIEHVSKKHELRALKEVNRVLKKNGKLVLSTPNDNLVTTLLDPAWYFGHRHYNRKYLKGLIKKAGFRIERFEVRGGIWFTIGLLRHYILKWIFNKPLSINEFLEKKDDQEFSKKNGIHTIFLVAAKI